MPGISRNPTVLISEEAIQKRVREMARQISADYVGAGEVLLVGVLRGCFIFLADLARRLEINRRIDFIAVSSYDYQPTTPGAVRLIMDLRTEIAGQHVLIVEDIVDSGRTLQYIGNLLRGRHPASLRTCALLRKPDRLREAVQIDYLGFDIPDVWVVGYGLDYADQGRALPYIGVLPKEQSPSEE
ncbi:MAG: hypoxanthine phosphoribosyltransferase [Desulfuromonadales bacterium]|jgi:hypoxanthine phosphoribosyltransferase